ncbi:hypothetical protein [Sphingosinicella terrae]|uniref:hypothetical protein n=1 Tax=Sphingosinicella terrae TaxID=2172047 RepID=UPI000E0CDA16|nr:hypothetical protein [Sphingosinicella terrae]
MKLFSLLVPAGALVFVAPAHACRSADYTLAIVHSAPPERVSPETVVAEVEFESDEVAALRGPGMRARIRRVIQGEVSGDFLIVRTAAQTSCDRPFANGTVGLIVGNIVGARDGLPIVNPRRVSRRNGFRLTGPSGRPD